MASAPASYALRALVLVCSCFIYVHTTSQEAPSQKGSFGSRAGDAASAEYALFQAEPKLLSADASADASVTKGQADKGIVELESGLPQGANSPEAVVDEPSQSGSTQQETNQYSVGDNAHMINGLAILTNASVAPGEAQHLHVGNVSNWNETAHQFFANNSMGWGKIAKSNATLDRIDQVNLTMRNVTTTIMSDLKTAYHSFVDLLGQMDCISNAELDVQLTYSGLERNKTHAIVSACEETGLLHQRVCTKAEVFLYLQTLGQAPVGPTNNCEEFPGRHLKGCYPGFASFVIEDTSPLGKKGVPWRTDRNRTIEQLACCPGFFCPEGLACMIPCPRGSFCPAAVLMKGAYSLCEPYKYHAYEGVCGGADVWGISTSHTHDKIFCWDGFFCPTTTDWPVVCPPGHYCPRGSQVPKKCGHLQACGPESGDVDARHFVTCLTAGGLVALYILLRTVDNFWRCKADHPSRPDGLPKAKSLLRHAIPFTKPKEKRMTDSPPESSWDSLQAPSKDSLVRADPQLNRRHSVQEPTRPRDREEAQGLESSHESSVLLLDKSVEVPERAFSTGGLKRRTSLTVVDGLSASEQPLSYGRDQVGDARKSWGVDLDSHPLLSVSGELGRAIFEGVQGDSVAGKRAELSVSDVFWEGQPRVELEFVDLTMVLPGGRKVMTGVNGRLRPGRLTAIMGPSGAGKSLLLHALAGKQTHCQMHGQIKINGRKRSRGLRDISGFVPQDDVVHGSLTVEENIWFSANYRLPAHATWQQKSDIVEHVLRALGLQGVRHSLVGSVERRGVSGGQRKRVSVGLEMVAQPSLLLLDEPTSGLDSVSSLQMLHALKEETTTGLNAAAVIHQPSYELLSLFDDVLLLNKGLVYLGPMPEVEAYFDSLGFPVPYRMNPADHFMNIMSDLVESTQGVLPGDLPQLWRKQQAARGESSAILTSPASPSDSPVKAHGDLAERVGEISKGLRNAAARLTSWATERKGGWKTWRQAPGFWRQFLVILLRLWKQQIRDRRQVLQDYVIVASVAILMGMILKYTDSLLGGSTLIQESILSIALISKLGVLRTFGADKLNFWRESASGVNKLAYFMAKDTSDHVHTVLKSYVYMTIFYYFKNMRSTYHDNVIVTLALSYCCTGMGYLLSIVFKPSPAQLSAAMTALVSLLLGSRENPRGTAGLLAKASYASYAGKAYFVANAKRYSGVWLLTRCALMKSAGFKMSDYGSSIMFLIAYGIVARACAYLALIVLDRDMQT